MHLVWHHLTENIRVVNCMLIVVLVQILPVNSIVLRAVNDGLLDTYQLKSLDGQTGKVYYRS